MLSSASHSAGIHRRDYSANSPDATTIASASEVSPSKEMSFRTNDNNQGLSQTNNNRKSNELSNDADFVNDKSSTVKSNRTKRKVADHNSSSDDDTNFHSKQSTSAHGPKIRKTTKHHTDGTHNRVKVESVYIKKENKSTHNSSSRKTAFTAASSKNSSKIKKEESDKSAKKKKAKQEEEADVWRWWEEEKSTDGRKWTTLCHNGPIFADSYQKLPSNVKFYYDGKPLLLCEQAEEVMTFYAKMIEHDYTKKDMFNENFMRDWRKYMTKEEREKIANLSKCNFSEVNAFFEKRSEERKNMSKEEKKVIKDANEVIKKKYGYCFWDNHRQPVGNYKIEPPGLFRGRGEHPRQGCVKKRIQPEDIIINCDKRAKPPEAPIGHKWKEVRHDNKVSWLATWNENIMNNNKYIMLNPSARVKAERDWQKYEKARKLHKIVDQIRSQYQTEWRSREMKIRQRAVALYFIDHLALRVGNEKEDDEADTVGCCSLRYEHIKLHDNLKEFGNNVVEFDFLGKDSIRYHNFVPVEIRVYKNLRLFLENKSDGDDLFDRVTTTSLNQYLTDLMEGLTAKVFRTYNASKTLQEQLDKLTNKKDSIDAKFLSYNRANREVAILCNHQRSIPKTFDVSMEKLKTKIDAKKQQVKELKKECKNKETDYKNTHNITAKKELDKRKIMLSRAKDQLTKLQIQATDKEENKQIALGTSKLNYLDPRITVAWCKKNSVPIEKIYSKTQRDKFMWAMHMTDETFHFHEYKGEIELKEESLSNNSQTEDAVDSHVDRDSEDQEDSSSR